MKNMLLKSAVLAIAGVGLLAGSVWASPIFYQVENGFGQGTITYDTDPTGGYDAPTFTFQGLSASSITNDFSGFTPGDYTLSVELDDFYADINEDGITDYTMADVDFTSPVFTLTSLPPAAGTYGQLTWNIDFANHNAFVSYNFGTSGPYTNQNVGATLAYYDTLYGHGANGVMNANMGWEHFRVQLNSVPEPASMLLFGTGLLGLMGVTRRKKK